MTLQQQIRANRLRSAFVVLLFVLLIAAVGAAIAFGVDRSLGVGVVAAGLAYGVISLLSSRRMVTSLAHATPVASKADDPELFRMVETVSIAAGLAKPPQIWVIDDPAPNALASGLRPDTSLVAVTTGLRRLMSRRELEAVIAHEVAHIRNRDTRLMTMAAVLVGVIAMICDIAFRMALSGRGRRDQSPVSVIPVIIALVLAPIAAVMLQMALSRRREFLADASAAAMLNDAEAMALALRKLQLDQQTLHYADHAIAHLFIESPVHRIRGVGELLGSLFQTHPPLDERIRRLEEAGGFRLG
ncbi:MAG: zinc metalloprotease HtpX [Actinobacteria bacterium]|nr:zinc metalloprotease HtpX [Actinomycetota bacterium]